MSEWIPVKLKFFDFAKTWGYLTSVEPPVQDIFVYVHEFKDAGIIWMPHGKVIWAQTSRDAKGLRATKLSFLKPKELLNVKNAQRPAAVQA